MAACTAARLSGYTRYDRTLLAPETILAIVFAAPFFILFVLLLILFVRRDGHRYIVLRFSHAYFILLFDHTYSIQVPLD
jgi:hypothetical protein